MADEDLLALPPPERLQILLFDAARMGRDDMIVPLLQAGAALEAQDEKGHTPLILASYHGHSTTTLALIKAGAWLDTPDRSRGNTALMGVAFKGHLDVVRILLKAGASVDQRNVAGQTALMMAALFGHLQIVEDLLAVGANPHSVDVVGNSAFSAAAAQGNADMVTLLATVSPLVTALEG